MTTPTFRLHHLGILVASIDTATELQVGRYGYRVESEPIADPIQVAVVRMLRLPNASSWLELVAPLNEGSKLNNTLRKRGEGLHHICYEVDDIQAACVNLREGGQWLLSGPVPAVAFGQRRIAWFLDRQNSLTELVESGPGPFVLPLPH